MKARKLNVGMVGAGFIGQIAHLSNLAGLENCRLVALAEMRPDLRRKVSQRFGIPRTYATHADLLKDPEVEAVVAVTPRTLTGPVALDCLKAGKHLLTEKPMAGTVKDGQKLVAAAKARKRHFVVGYMKRYDEGVVRAKRMLGELLSSGRLGPVTFVRAHCFIGRDNSFSGAVAPIVAEEKFDYAASKGWPMAPSWVPEGRRRHYEAYINNFCHDVNLLRFLFDRTPSVDHVDFRSFSAQLAVFDFGDFRATLETGGSTLREADELVEVYFQHGKLTLRLPPALLKNESAHVKLECGEKIQEITSPQIPWSWAFQRQAAAFVDDVLAGRESVSSGADALEDLRLAEQMWRLEIRRA